MTKQAKLCISCKKADAYPEGKFRFEHAGIVLWVPREGHDCDECEKRQLIERYEQFGKKILRGNEKKEPVVNWKKIDEISRSRREEGAEVYINFLRAIGILSRESKGNWELVAPGVALLNPTVFGPLYFMREEDVKAYAKYSYGKALYSWEIRHICKVITREELLKKK